MPHKNSQINFTMGQAKAPCKDCPDRFAGYHSVCVKYKDYKQAHEKEKEQIQAIQEQEQRYLEYVAKTKKRLKGGKK